MTVKTKYVSFRVCIFYEWWMQICTAMSSYVSIGTLDKLSFGKSSNFRLDLGIKLLIIKNYFMY